MRLTDKTALVTGATSGLGYAAAERFIADGARVVVITGQNEERLAAAAQALGNRVVPVRADVRNVADLDRLAAATHDAVDGRLDILFANAGVGNFGPLESTTEAFYDEQFDVNVRGLFFTVQKLLPLLGEGSSVILNSSSINAKGMAGGAVYSATKAAVRSLARSFAAELGPRGIRVNAVSPGMVPTPFFGKTGFDAATIEGFETGFKASMPLGRVGTAEEIASAVAFLAGPDAAFITATDLTVDGGYMNV